MKLEEMLSRANELFGVSLDALNTRIGEQITRACLENIETAFQKVQEPNVARQFALANIGLEVVKDYDFLVSEYEQLAEFSQGFDTFTQVNTTELILEGIKKHKEDLKDVEKGYKEAKKDTIGIKKKAIDIALGTVGEYFELLDKTTKKINRKSVTGVVKEDKKRIGEEQEDNGLSAKVGAGADTSQKARRKGKSVLCFEIEEQTYYRVNEIADMFSIDLINLRSRMTKSVKEDDLKKLEGQSYLKNIIYTAKRYRVFSLEAFTTILPAKYHESIDEVLAKHSLKPAQKDEYRLIEEEAESVDNKVQARGSRKKGHAGEGSDSGQGRAETRARAARDTTKVAEEQSAVYYIIRGKRYYSAPESAKFLGVDYYKLGYNSIPDKRLLELEQQGKVKAVKRKKGGSTKVYREDVLVELLPEKLRQSMDPLKKVKVKKYDDKFRVSTLADIGISVDGYKPQPQQSSARQDVDNGVAARVRKAESQRKVRPETPMPPQEIPANFKKILNAEGLEQTVGGAEILYFLAINGQRYFPTGEVRKVYENKEYEGRTVNFGAFGVYIAQRRRQGRFPDGSLLKIMMLNGFQGRKVNAETYFLREDVVQLAIPNYVTDSFSELATGHSMQQFPLEYIDTETVVGEIKRYGLDKTSKSKQKGNGRRKSKGDVDSNPDASLEKRVETHDKEGRTGKNGTEVRDTDEEAHTQEIMAIPYFTIGGAKYFKLKDVASLELTQPKIDEFEKKGVIRYVVSVGKPMKSGAGTHGTPVIHEEYVPEFLDEEMRKRFSKVFVKIPKQEIPSNTYRVTDKNKQPIQVTTALVDIEVPSQGSGQGVREETEAKRDVEIGVTSAEDDGHEVGLARVAISEPASQSTEETLERTVENEEGRLYFLDVQGRRYFPVLSIHVVFSGKKYENVNITDPELYLKIINKRIKKQQVPNDACLMVNVISGPEDEPISGAQWFVDEAYVKEAALPNSITIRFKDAIERYSLKTYPIEKINKESLETEMKRCGLAQEGNLISYDELPVSLDSDMETIDSVCKSLENEDKIRFNYTELGTEGPKLLHPKYLLRIAHVLKTSESIASEMLRT